MFESACLVSQKPRGGEQKAAWMCGGEGESGYLLFRFQGALNPGGQASTLRGKEKSCPLV